MLIREEVPADIDAIAELNRIAFGGDYEADLIARLRAEGLVIASLVTQIRAERRWRQSRPSRPEAGALPRPSPEREERS